MIAISVSLWGSEDGIYVDGLCVLSRSNLLRRHGVIIVVCYDEKSIGSELRRKVTTQAIVPVLWLAMSSEYATQRVIARFETMTCMREWGISNVIFADTEECDHPRILILLESVIHSKEQSYFLMGNDDTIDHRCDTYSDWDVTGKRVFERSHIFPCGGGIAISCEDADDLANPYRQLVIDKEAHRLRDTMDLSHCQNPRFLRKLIRAESCHGLDEILWRALLDQIPKPKYDAMKVVPFDQKMQTRKRARDLRDAMEIVPMDRIMRGRNGTVLVSMYALTLPQVHTVSDLTMQVMRSGRRTPAAQEPDGKPSFAFDMLSSSSKTVLWIRNILLNHLRANHDVSERDIDTVMSIRWYNSQDRRGICDHVDDCDYSAVTFVEGVERFENIAESEGDLVVFSDSEFPISIPSSVKGATVIMDGPVLHRVCPISSAARRRISIVQFRKHRPTIRAPSVSAVPRGGVA